jgi:DNA-binding XRE family transcriptional regulator
MNSSLEKSLAAFARHVNTKCDWKDADDVVFWRKVERRRRRRRVLDELVPDRKCPCCQETRIGPGEWMVRMDGAIVLCRSCYTRLRPKTGVVAAGLFTREVRWTLDGAALRQLRIDAGVSQRDFAILMGVSSARVHQIESHAKSISDEQKERIVKALQECGVTFIGE